MIVLAGRLLFIAVIVAAALSDFKSRRIPNALTFPTMLAALPLNLLLLGLPGAGFWLAGLATGACLLLVPYLLGGLGAGDVKMLAMSGAMLGSFQVFCAFVAASVLGSLMAVAAASRRPHIAAGESANNKKNTGIPYGLPLAAGVLLSAAGVWL